MSLVAMSWVRHRVYMQVPGSNRLSFPPCFSRTSVFIFTHLSFSPYLSSTFLFFSTVVLLPLYATTQTIPTLVWLCCRRELKTLWRWRTANATSGNRVVDIEIDRGVSIWSVAKYKKHFADTLDARRFGAMFLDGAISFIFDRRNVHRDTDICAWTRRCTLRRRWCPDTPTDTFGFDMLIVRHVEEVRYLHSLLRFVRNVDFTSEYHGLDVCGFVHPIDGFYFVKAADACWRELDIRGRQRNRGWLRDSSGDIA